MEDSHSKCIFLSEGSTFQNQYFPFLSPHFFWYYHFQRNLGYFQKNGFNFFLINVHNINISHCQSDKLINNQNAKGTRGINPYAFKLYEDCEVLYMKKADQSYFVLSNSNKGKLQRVWQRHVNQQFAIIQHYNNCVNHIKSLKQQEEFQEDFLWNYDLQFKFILPD